MAILLSGKATSALLRKELQGDVEAFHARTGVSPGLAVILVGEDPASQIYVRNKQRGCAEVGISSFLHALPEETTEEELLALVASCNANPAVHGILCQLPLPAHIDEHKVLLSIDPRKDVDGFHPMNVGALTIGNPSLLPCTPAGILALLRRADISVEGKHCVVIGRSNIVGKPTALLLLRENGTVTICHSKTRDLAAITRTADILVSAVGRPRFITGEMVKEGAVVIDVGMNRLPDGHLVGDVDFAAVEPRVAAITPVPGGVGPMTITMLLRNTLTAAQSLV